MVDENKVEGTAKKLGGKVQGVLGALTGDVGTQARGKLNQAAGTTQEALASVADTAGEWRSNIAVMARVKPVTALLVAFSLGFILRALTHTSRR